MGKHRNRRRFYPEFYTDEELKQIEAEEREKSEKTVAAHSATDVYDDLPGHSDEENFQEYYIRNAPDMPDILPEEPVGDAVLSVPHAPEIPEILDLFEEETETLEELAELEELEEIIETTDAIEETEETETSEFDGFDYVDHFSGEPEEIQIQIPPDLQAAPVFAPVIIPEPEPEHEYVGHDDHGVPHETEHVGRGFPDAPHETLREEIIPGLIPFDREKAIEYARRWAMDRNPDYYNFEDIGGDCTNYISQILLAGGCNMDRSSPVYGWYYNNANDKSPSWTGVEQLYNYLIREKDRGIIAKEIALHEAEAGDIAQLSFNGKTFQHTPFIVSVERGPDGGISYDGIKICAHSYDSCDRPLTTYQWRGIRFIRILGWKEQ